MHTRRWLVLAAVVLALAVPEALRARTLYWSSIHVEARLDRDGRLHVRETQNYVFDGDWNGGERIFRVAPGQGLSFDSIARIDESGREKKLARGSLERVDHYDFTSSNTLRWRSRRPADAPFRNERITYVLSYTLTNILVRRGNEYLLHHAFLFPERQGRVERFTLHLKIDEPWAAESREIHRDLDYVADGEAAVVTLPLTYSGAGAPKFVRQPALDPRAQRVDAAPLRRSLLAVLLVCAAIAWFIFYRREKALGRFDPLPAVGRRWMEEHILALRAETVGAAWDGAVTQAEVAAMLARLVAEKKIASWTLTLDGEPELHMELQVPHESFTGYEREIVDALFFDGPKTDTTLIRAHYESSGLDPAELIRDGVMEDVEKLLTERLGDGNVITAPASLAVIAVIAAFVASPPDEKAFAVAGGAGLLLLSLLAVWVGRRWQQRPDFGRRQALLLLAPWAGLVAVLAALFQFDNAPFVYLALSIAALCGVAASTVAASSKESRSSIEFRRKLAAVRMFFKQQLAREKPSLDDTWFPYILAFGLSKEAEAWFQAFGGRESHDRHRAFGGSGSSFSGGESARGWTGGGGAFGGAGASGAWVAAASGMAAGVASPGSSGGGSGGGGGGASSGGGGGGGW